MAKVQGLFVGYRKFAVDREWLRQQEEQRYRDRQRQFDEWSRKWALLQIVGGDKLIIPFC